jgi:hypothetical protein
VTYTKCPKCGGESGGLEICPKCGLIFAKYLKSVVGGAPVRAPSVVQEEERFRLGEWLFFVPEEINPTTVYVRAGLLLLLAVYGVHLAMMDVPSGEIYSSLMHPPLIPIHEFGHIVFMAFGEFMHNLGGTLFQVLLPLIFGGVLLVKNRDPFAASVTLWWSAVAMIDAAPYVYDAYKPEFILLTGRTGDTGGHDFVDVLGDLGLLNKAQPIGYGVRWFGVGMMAVALAWGAYILWQQYRRKTA